MAGQIDVWCNKTQIAPKLVNRVQLVFEETVRLLMPLLESPRIQAVCEYSEATENAEWTVSYGGGHFDLTGAGDELALALLRGMTASMEYTFDEEQELKNRLCLVVKTT